MPSVLAYHRPESLDEASALLAGPNRIALAGGTQVVPDARLGRSADVEVIDLQALGLDTITEDTGLLHIGAMVRLGDLAADARTPSLIADLCRRELPSAMRNQATVGGTIAVGSHDSVLCAGLLAYGAEVAIHGQPPVPLEQLFAEGVGDHLITGVAIHPDGTGVIAATGRTPGDLPIVAAIAHQGVDDGLRLALTGVGPAPVLAHPADPTGDLRPLDDFRGSASYRLHLADVLSARALREVV